MSDFVPPTVRHVWRMALPLGTRLVAGEAGLNRPVRWARSSGHNLPLFPGLSAEELALLDLKAARVFNPSLSLARVVRALAEVPVSALATYPPVDATARARADEVGIPLFELPPESDLQRVARAVIRLVSDPEAQEEARGGELLSRLTRKVAEGRGVKGVLADLARLTGHKAELRLFDGTVFTEAPPGRSLSASQREERVEAPVHVGERQVGVLGLVDCTENLDHFSRLAAAQGAAALAMELAKLQAVTEAQQALQADLLDVILANEGEEVVRARARTLGYELEGTHVVLVAEAPGHEFEHLSLWGRRVVDLTQRRGWSVLAMPRDHRLVLFAGTQADRFAGLESWLEEVRSTWSGGALTLGVGEPAAGLSGLKQSLAQAEDARALGTRLFGHGRTYRYSELGLYQLFRHLQGHPEVTAFYERTLAPLVTYDAEHGTNLVETLDVLLARGGNVSRAAQALHVHRNSLIYRVERIREICGLDPLDPDDAFTLRLALLLRPLVA